MSRAWRGAHDFPVKPFPKERIFREFLVNCIQFLIKTAERPTSFGKCFINYPLLTLLWPQKCCRDLVLCCKFLSKPWMSSFFGNKQENHKSNALIIIHVFRGNWFCFWSCQLSQNAQNEDDDHLTMMLMVMTMPGGDSGDDTEWWWWWWCTLT